MKNDDAAKTLTHIITQRPSTVSERTEIILSTLREKKKASFMDLMLVCRSRSEIIASFMAILALISSQKIIARYDENDQSYNPEIHLVEERGES